MNTNKQRLPACFFYFQLFFLNETFYFILYKKAERQEKIAPLNLNQFSKFPLFEVPSIVLTVQTFSPNMLNSPVFPVFWRHLTFRMMFDDRMLYPSPSKEKPTNHCVGMTEPVRDNVKLFITALHSKQHISLIFSLASEEIKITQVTALDNSEKPEKLYHGLVCKNGKLIHSVP